MMQQISNKNKKEKKIVPSSLVQMDGETKR